MPQNVPQKSPVGSEDEDMQISCQSQNEGCLPDTGSDMDLGPPTDRIEIVAMDTAGANTNPAKTASNTGERNAGSISEVQIHEFIDKNFPLEAALPSQNLDGPENSTAITSQSSLASDSIRSEGTTVIEENFKQPKALKRKKPLSVANGTSPKKQLLNPEIENADDSLEELEMSQMNQLNIYTEDQVSQWYYIPANVQNVSRTIVPSKIPEAFKILPIHGLPNSKAELKTFLDSKIKDFVGNGLTDEEFSSLAKYCSPDHLLTGKELDMQTNTPSIGIFCDEMLNKTSEELSKSKLCIVNKFRMRKEKDATDMYVRRLKYRGIRLIPMPVEDESTDKGTPLSPGQDLIFHIRIYRPFCYQKQKFYRGRHSVFCRDLVMVGRQRLEELRDSFLCVNDLDMRVDVSHAINDTPRATAKELFPSGFLFINNVFYVDTRAGCSDPSERIRRWAASKPGLGAFPARNLADYTLADLTYRLGHPEVYVHQGNCEHLFTVSEIRLLSPLDPWYLSQYPCHSAISQNQTIYCTTCAEFGAKFIVTDCRHVPFDPAFFCDTCLKSYLYIDGVKRDNLKAYTYRGNEMHALKQPA